MKDILQFLSSTVGAKAIAVVGKLCDCIISLLHMIDRHSDSLEKKTLESKKNYEQSKIKDVVDRGTLDDLLNLKTVILLLCVIFSGCQSQIVIQSTKSWEGHYYSQKEVQNAVESMKLEPKESVWIISNSTLKRVLIDKNEKQYK